MEQPTEHERITEIEKDTEVTARLLGALGLVDASLYDHPTTERVDSVWTQPNIILGSD